MPIRDPAGLEQGIYTGFLMFTSSDSTVSTVSMPVTLVVGCGAATCPQPQPAVINVTNGANFRRGGSPGEIETIFGQYLADQAYTASTYPLPATLGATRVLVNGVAAPLFYASPGQINFQMPAETPPGQTHIEVVTGSGLGSSMTESPIVTPVQPGLFVSATGRASALNPDLTPHTPSTPLAAGSVVALFLTGMGRSTPPVPDGGAAPASPLSVLNGAVQAQIGGRQATVQFAGLAPGFAGLVQVNVAVPAGLAAGNQPVFVSINGVPSNVGVISVK